MREKLCHVLKAIESRKIMMCSRPMAQRSGSCINWGGASVVHCRLPVGAVSIPVKHRTVEEIWYFLAGEGQVWRVQGEREGVLDTAPGHQPDDSAGHAVSIPQYGRCSAGICHRDDSALAGRG